MSFMKFQDDDIKQLFAKMKNDPAFGGDFDVQKIGITSRIIAGFQRHVS